MAGQFGQGLLNFRGDWKELIGYCWSRKFNGYSVIWDGGITRGMLAKDVPWFYPSRVDSPTLRATGLWTLGRNAKSVKKPLPKVVVSTNKFIDQLPKNVPIHGELWYNDDIQFVKRGARRKEPSPFYWDKFKFLTFAVKPYATFHNGAGFVPNPSPFLSALKSRCYYWDKLEGIENDTVKIIQQNKMNSITQVADAFSLLENSPWEGLVFTDPNSRYENRKSSACYKYKPFYEHSATIVDYTEGKRRHEGRAGALLVNMTLTDSMLNAFGFDPNLIGKNVTFKISGGLTDYTREWENITDLYPIGSLVDFKYESISKDGIPAHCVLLGEGYGY